MEKKNSKKTSIILSVIFFILSIIAIIITILTVTPKSAYNIAVKNGFVGTEQQWLESLKGSNGELGKTIEQITAENLNARLKDVDTTKYKTISERFNNAGILNSQLTRLTKRYLYSYKDNKIIVIDDAGYVAYSIGSYQKDTLLLSGNDLFCFTTSNSISNSYSNYLVGGTNLELNISTGLDVGSLSNIATINFSKNENEEDIIISTNSQGTTLNIEDKSNGGIKHFGKVGIVNIIECNIESYHEYGTVSFIEIAKGRIVLEPTSKIEAIHIDSKKEDNVSTNTYDSIIIADNGLTNLPKIITRDKVSVTEATLVVKIENIANNVIEEVYVYPYEYNSVQTGTTEKTEIQNQDVSSNLGLKIIDSNTFAGEKALSLNEIVLQKESYASFAKTVEFNEKNKDDSQFENYVARIGETGYKSLDDAISSVNDGEFIVVLKDISISGWVEIKKPNIGFTIDVAGNEIERLEGSLFDIYSKVIFKDSLGTGKITAKGRVFYCNAGADCTLESGNIFNEEGSCVNIYGDYASLSQTIPIFTMNGGNVVCEECFYMDAKKYGAKLVINDGNINAKELAISAFNNKDKAVDITINGGKIYANGDYGITINGNYGGANVTITGGEIENGKCCAIYMPGQNTYTISGGKFKGREAIVVKGGIWNITGGEFISIGEAKNPEAPEGSGYSPTGDCLYIEDNYGEKTSPHNITMNISNAKFTSQKGYAISCRFFSVVEGKQPAIVNLEDTVELFSGENKKKVCFSNGFLGNVNGVDTNDIENK